MNEIEPTKEQIGSARYLVGKYCLAFDEHSDGEATRGIAAFLAARDSRHSRVEEALGEEDMERVKEIESKLDAEENSQDAELELYEGGYTSIMNDLQWTTQRLAARIRALSSGDGKPEAKETP